MAERGILVPNLATTSDKPDQTVAWISLGLALVFTLNPNDPADHEFEFTRGQTSRIFTIVGAICVLLTLPFFALAAKMFRRRPQA